VTLKKEKVTIIALSNRYTKKVYDAIRISSLFGDYPYQLKEEQIVKTKTEEEIIGIE